MYVKSDAGFFNQIENGLPIVEEVIDERKPRTQEKGRERAIAPVPIFATCVHKIIRTRKTKRIYGKQTETAQILPEVAQGNKSRQAC